MEHVDPTSQRENSLFGVQVKGPPISIPKPTGAPPALYSSPTGHDESPRPHAGKTNFMYVLKLICLTIANLVKQAWLLPRTIGLAHQQRLRELTRHQFETERLDRIRNPSKYAGR